MAGAKATFEVALSLLSDRFDDDDGTWLEQKDQVAAQLSDLSGVEVIVAEPTRTKGLTDGIILALGSAGAFTAATEWLKLWLARDRSRSIELEYVVDGRRSSMVVRGTGLNEDSFTALAEAVSRSRTDEPK